jgi:hypothetical protein
VPLLMCPSCRGVWLDRGELEKLMDSATQDGRASVPASVPPPPAQPYPPQQPASPQPWGAQPAYRDDRYRSRDDDDYRYKKKRDSIFDIFD